MKCKHTKILYEREKGFSGVHSDTRDMCSVNFVDIPARNTVVNSYCVECGKRLKTYKWNDNIIKLKIK